MTSTELRRIVGAMNQPGPGDCPADGPCAYGHVTDERCAWLSGIDARERAETTLANHADAIVALVEACEALLPRMEHTLAGPIGSQHKAQIQAFLRALAAVHTIRETP